MRRPWMHGLTKSIIRLVIQLLANSETLAANSAGSRVLSVNNAVSSFFCFFFSFCVKPLWVVLTLAEALLAWSFCGLHHEQHVHDNFKITNHAMSQWHWSSSIRFDSSELMSGWCDHPHLFLWHFTLAGDGLQSLGIVNLGHAGCRRHAIVILSVSPCHWFNIFVDNTQNKLNFLFSLQFWPLQTLFWMETCFLLMCNCLYLTLQPNERLKQAAEHGLRSLTSRHLKRVLGTIACNYSSWMIKQRCASS